ncbi:MAG: acetate uptake transporter [Kineosporiaceae bacterium]|nr:acetate uptake transporter [Kineosporiaceae bacterium]
MDSPSRDLPLDVRISAVPERVPFTARVADPGPLGLACFALTTFVLSCFNAGLLPSTVKAVVLGLALFYGGVVQVIAGIVEYAKGNAFGGTAFCSYGAFWMAYWYLSTHLSLMAKASPGDVSRAIGVFLLAWTIFTIYMFVVSFRTNAALVITFGMLTAALIALTIGDLAASPDATLIGGWLGLVTAALAWYASFAGVMNATAGRVVLPVVPLKK